MNPPKVRDEDYINFIIATPRTVTATFASSCQPRSTNAPSHDAFTRLLSRLEPDPEVLWTEAQTQIDLNRGILESRKKRGRLLKTPLKSDNKM